MSNIKLKDRIETYQSDNDYRLTRRLPIIVSVNGRSTHKVSNFLDKPFSEDFAHCMSETMQKLCLEVDGVLFAYQHNDEIVLVIKNDQTLGTMPWYDNRVQKIVSVISSIATLQFSKSAEEVNLHLHGGLLFGTQAFVVPTVVEAINTLVYKQQYNFNTSLEFSCFYELLKKQLDKNTIKEMMFGLSTDDKISLLLQECNIDINDYPSSFRRGVACYRILQPATNNVVKNKWFVNNKLPIFTKDQTFLNNIIKDS